MLNWARPLRDERGSIFVVAALAMLCLSLLAAGMIQVGGWFQHRRHLQTRADAAALAGAQQFNACFDKAAFPTDAAANQNIKSWATAYAGFATADTVAAGAPKENLQFGGGSDPLPAFNSPQYPDGTGLDPTAPPADICDPSNLALDVKLADNSIPALFSLFGLGNVHAHARVELRAVQATRPTLPLAIPNFDTSNVGVTFVDESGGELTGCTGAVVAGTTCTYASASAPIIANGYKQWTLSLMGVNLPAAGASGRNIGVRVSAGSQIGSCAGTAGANQYACFDAGSNDGALMIRDYAASAGTQPQLYGVWPSSSCGTGSPFFSDSSPGTSCGVTLKAEVDFGSGSTDPSLDPLGAGLTATVNGTTIKLTPQSYDATRDAWIWAAPGNSASIPIAADGSGSEYPVTMDWTSKTKFGNKKSGTFGTVQRFTSATDDDDGPLKDIALADDGTAPISAYSLTPGAHTLSVDITLRSSGITNKLTILRGSHKGSDTSLIECVTGAPPGDPGVLQGIQKGCTTEYQINPVPACPDSSTPYADCALNKPSSDNGQLIPKGMNLRLLCNTKTPALNHWPDFTQAGDPRAVTLITTTYNAFINGGRNEYPVTGFGDFYITGFSGSNCPQSGAGADDPPPAGAGKSDIWGYFIKYSRQGGVPSSLRCDPNSLGECVAVLTR